MRKPVSFESFYEFTQSVARQYGERRALTTQDKDGWKTLTYENLFDRSLNLARFLKLKNIEPGDRVVILSESRIEFPEMLLGIFMTGAVAVPLDAKLSAYEVHNIIDHAQPKTIFVSDLMWDTFCQAQLQSEQTYSFFRIDNGEEGRGLNNLEAPKTIQIQARDPNELNLIIYTSGTSGKPKGVMTSGRALLFEYEQIGDIAYDDRLERGLSILPMNHLFEMTAGLFGNLSFGTEIVVARNLEKDHLMYCLGAKRITHMCTVPLFLKSIKEGIEGKVKAAGFAKRGVFAILMFLSSIIPVNSFRKILFGQVHKSLGGDLFRFISGGAPLPKEIAQFYALLGIEVYEGYGLSETGPIITANKDGAVKWGSAGKKIKGIEVKIDRPEGSEDHGEILTQGPHVMMGYFKNEALTHEVIDNDGWFHTGDIGFVDNSGFLFITGRKKKMIVLEGGKKVMAEEVEDVLESCPQVAEVCVMGSQKITGQIGGREEVVAAVVPSESVKQDFDNLDDIEKFMVAAVQQSSKVLAAFKRPTQVVVIHDELPKTTTMKVKLNEAAELVRQRMNLN